MMESPEDFPCICLVVDEAEGTGGNEDTDVPAEDIQLLEKLFKEDKGKKDEVSAEALACAESAIERLVRADRILAETLMIDAAGVTVVDPNNQDKVDRELAKASEELLKGDAERDAGKFDKAIQRYRKAWEHACHAIKEAAKAK
jgi:hypothetical protein